MLVTSLRRRRRSMTRGLPKMIDPLATTTTPSIEEAEVASEATEAVKMAHLADPTIMLFTTKDSAASAITTTGKIDLKEDIMTLTD